MMILINLLKVLYPINCSEDYSISRYGVHCLPGGEEYYKACLQWHTTSSLSPQDIHTVGLQEVARISRNMHSIMAELDFAGSIADFAAHLRKQPEFFHTEPAEMLKEFEEIMTNHIAPKLPDFFEHIPDVPCLVKEMPFEGPGNARCNNCYKKLFSGIGLNVFYSGIKCDITLSISLICSDGI